MEAKTSKLGRLPNCSFDLRKPMPLGAMLRNCAEFHSICLVHQDSAQSLEIKNLKKNYDEKSSAPGSSKI